MFFVTRTRTKNRQGEHSPKRGVRRLLVCGRCSDLLLFLDWGQRVDTPARKLAVAEGRNRQWDKQTCNLIATKQKLQQNTGKPKQDLGVLLSLQAAGRQEWRKKTIESGSVSWHLSPERLSSPETSSTFLKHKPGQGYQTTQIASK